MPLKGEKRFQLEKKFFLKASPPPPTRKNRAVYEIIWQNYFIAGQATDDNMAHVHSMLDT